ncbi:MAG: LamG domain-containing protein [Lachnospiraceae bacterium]|nr:LamG domain-containing protein [Lachnospiraceae bacterium]
MENKIKNAYTAYHIDNSESFGNFISIDTVTPGINIAAFDLWFCVTGCADVLISQKNGFSMGIRNHQLVFQHPKMQKQVWQQKNVERLPDKIWHNLYMGYDSKEICVYVDGILFYRHDFDNSPFTSDAFMLGEEFTGYIRSFRVYENAIGEADYKNYCFASDYHPETMPHVTAFLDFSKEEIPNLCQGKADVRIHEGCSPVSLVSVYCPLSGNSAVLPKPVQSTETLFTDTFSIYSKLYTRPSEREYHVIASYGENSEDDYVEIFAKKSGENTKFGIRLGSQEYLFQQKTESFKWVDVIVSVHGETLTAYINGVKETRSMKNGFTRKGKGDFRIGGGCSPEAGSEYYFHTEAVFRNALTATDAADFMENHPFIFEDDLAALVRFEDNSAMEYVSGKKLLIDDKDLFLAENTVDALSDSPYQCRIAYTKTPPSEMSRWKAALYVNVHLGFMKEVFGLVPSPGERLEKIKDVMIRYFANYGKVLGQVTELYTKPHLTPSEVLQAVSGKDKAAYYRIYQGMDCLLESEAALSAPAAFMGGAAVAAAFENLPAYIAIGIAVFLSVGSVILTLIRQLRKKKPDEEEGELHLLSVCFQHKPDDYSCSAVRCRNYKGVISGNEWTSMDKSVGSAVYIADQIEKVKIKIRFMITNQSAESAGSYDVYIGADVIGGESWLFNGFSYKKSGLAAGREYEAVLECEEKAQPAADFSCTEVELFWGGKINQTSTVLPNTKTKIYVIPTTPCLPIYLEEGFDEDFIAVEYLDLLSKMKEETGLENAGGRQGAGTEGRDSGQEEWLNRPHTLQELKEITQRLYQSRSFKYSSDGDPFYDPGSFLKQEWIRTGQAQPVILITFTEGSFLWEAVKPKATPLAIECDVYAAILCYFFRLHHVDAKIVQMVNPVLADRVRGEHERLHFENVCPAGQKESMNIDFTAHLLVEVPPQPNVTGVEEKLLFDASMGIMTEQEIQALAGYPFSRAEGVNANHAAEPNTYRGTVIRNGTGAVLLSDRYAFTRKVF